MALAPSWIVIHTMVGSLAAANARFQSATQQVSAHYGVGLDGRLVQWVKESDAAWHCGNYSKNLDSIGIEHEDGGRYNDPRPDALYTASAQLVADIARRYPASFPFPLGPQILKHSQIVPTGCPDALDVARIVRMANDLLKPAPPAPPPPPPPPPPPLPPVPAAPAGPTREEFDAALAKITALEAIQTLNLEFLRGIRTAWDKLA